MLFKRKQSPASISCVAAVLAAYTLGSACICSAQTKTAALPAAGGAPGAPPANTTPVDITADEQDFAGDVVIARGNVRVKFKDSIITGPEAQLFKDASGQAQMAIFTGHPHLVQNKNRINADKLTFQMAINKIIADGHAHSEVSGDANTADPADASAQETPGAAGTPRAANAKIGDEGPQPPAGSPLPKVRFPMASDPQPGAPGAKAQVKTKLVAATPKPTPAPTPAPAPEKKKAEAGSWQMDEEADAPAPAAAGGAATATAAAAPAAPKPTEKILVDSEHQEYDSESGHFVAIGHCKVRHGDMKVDSNALNLVYGADGKPETALFSGSVNAMQNGNNTKSDHMTYSLSTQRMQASGNVRSKVLQQRPAKSEPKKGAQASLNQKSTEEEKVKVRGADGTIKELTAAEAEKFGIKSEKAKQKSKTFELTMDSDEPIYIVSDSSDYSKDNGRMTAIGNVHVYYNDNKGLGHKVLLIRNEEGKAERLIFTGRSQVIQPGKRWIGDKIQFLIPSEKVIAEGNTRAIILNTNAQVVPPQASIDEGSMPEIDSTASSQVDAQVVKDPDSTNNDNRALGTTKVENTQ